MLIFLCYTILFVCFIHIDHNTIITAVYLLWTLWPCLSVCLFLKSLSILWIFFCHCHTSQLYIHVQSTIFYKRKCMYQVTKYDLSYQFVWCVLAYNFTMFLGTFHFELFIWVLYFFFGFLWNVCVGLEHGVNLIQNAYKYIC